MVPHAAQMSKVGPGGRPANRVTRCWHQQFLGKPGYNLFATELGGLRTYSLTLDRTTI